MVLTHVHCPSFVRVPGPATKDDIFVVRQNERSAAATVSEIIECEGKTPRGVITPRSNLERKNVWNLARVHSAWRLMTQWDLPGKRILVGSPNGLVILRNDPGFGTADGRCAVQEACSSTRDWSRKRFLLWRARKLGLLCSIRRGPGLSSSKSPPPSR